MGLTGQNAFYTACAYLHGPVFVFGGAISVCCAGQLVPLFVAYRRHLPPAGGSLSKGEPLAEPAGLVLIR